MSAGELQAWSWEARGWNSKSFLVRFLYDSSALLIIDWKLEDNAAVR